MGNTPLIELLKVHSKFQRQNIGTVLVKAAAQEFLDLGHKQFINSAEIDNPHGLNFHRKMGFQLLAELALPHGAEEFYKRDIANLLE